MDNESKTIVRAPLVCTRGVIVFPNQEVIIDVGRERSMRAVEDARQQFDRRVVLVSQKDLTIEDPEVSDLYSVGSLCEIHPPSGWLSAREIQRPQPCSAAVSCR